MRHSVEHRQYLDFERPLVELEERIGELRLAGGPGLEGEIRRLERKARQLQGEIFSELTPWQIVQLSRHPLRPYALDYLGLMIEDFFELHGDRAFRDDSSIVGGIGRLRGQPLMIIANQKGRGTKDNLRRNFGMPRPEGYRKAARLMQLAGQQGLPLLTLIDTPGAYPGLDAEERGQAQAIAANLELMASLAVPIVSVVIGEGGSGGALALGLGDRILMLEYATYSVISPEGCAAILWKDPSKAEAAARQMKLTASDVRELGVADQVIEEPPGGAHRDPAVTSRRLEEAVHVALDQLRGISSQSLLASRYEKYRRIGAFSTLGTDPEVGL